MYIYFYAIRKETVQKKKQTNATSDNDCLCPLNIFRWRKWLLSLTRCKIFFEFFDNPNTAQKMKFSIKDFFSKYEQDLQGTGDLVTFT